MLAASAVDMAVSIAPAGSHLTLLHTFHQFLLIF
jgi:hypothetical protein